MKALHFGAGNIGRGFIGKLLADAGLHVTFADVNDDVVSALAERNAYPVRTVGETEVTENVTNVTAIRSDSEALLDVMTRVDLITTAVGPNVLKFIAPTVAKGLALRQASGNEKPLNIIACENMVRGTSAFKAMVLEALPEESVAFVAGHVGFVDSAVDRIVPPADAGETDVLAVTVESFSEWIVDQTQFVGEIPVISGMEPTDNLMAFVERKLFTLNTGHLITAYLGYLAGKKTIKDAIEDGVIAAKVKAAMEESGAVLIKRYGFDAEAHAQYIDKVLKRFANPYLVDEVDRVGRQPIRKLGAGDRLIKPLNGTLEYGLPNAHLLLGIAGAFLYQNDDDPQAVELQAYFAEHGFKATLAHYAGLGVTSDIVAQAEATYEKLSAERQATAD